MHFESNTVGALKDSSALPSFLTTQGRGPSSPSSLRVSLFLLPLLFLPSLSRKWLTFDPEWTLKVLLLSLDSRRGRAKNSSTVVGGIDKNRVGFWGL